MTGRTCWIDNACIIHKRGRVMKRCSGAALEPVVCSSWG